MWRQALQFRLSQRSSTRVWPDAFGIIFGWGRLNLRSGWDLKLIRSRYFIGGATAAGAISGLRSSTFTFSRTAFYAVTRSAKNPFKFFRLAVGASKLHLIFFFHDQYLKTVITFQTPEFIKWHWYSLCLNFSNAIICLSWQDCQGALLVYSV